MTTRSHSPAPLRRQLQILGFNVLDLSKARKSFLTSEISKLTTRACCSTFNMPGMSGIETMPDYGCIGAGTFPTILISGAATIRRPGKIMRGCESQLLACSSPSTKKSLPAGLSGRRCPIQMNLPR